MEYNEAKLIQRLRRGDQLALDTLYTKYWERLYRSSYAVLKDQALCEDVLQNVFLELWIQREKLQIKTSLQSYLYACVRYQTFAQIRLLSKRKEISTDTSLPEVSERITPETELLYSELTNRIQTTVDSMPDRCKEVYTLSRDQGLSHQQISERLSISLKTVENHITKALRTIRASLGFF